MLEEWPAIVIPVDLLEIHHPRRRFAFIPVFPFLCEKWAISFSTTTYDNCVGVVFISSGTCKQIPPSVPFIDIAPFENGES